jgi:membrane glycosyltransferase
MAKAGFVCGLLSVTLGCCCAGLPFNLLGLIFSLIALIQRSENPQRYGGGAMALLGLILSILGCLLLALFLMLH